MQELSPAYVRVQFYGLDLDEFGTGGLDQRIKLVFPLADGTLPELGHDWFRDWRALPDHRRNPIRTYTVRSIDPARRLLTVDFVRHGVWAGAWGPAARWLDAARRGDDLVVIGPNARSPQHLTGIDWHPGAARTVLLVGDETAVPAACAILPTVDEGRSVTAYLEVPTAADVPTLDLPARVHVTWLPRDGHEPGARLRAAVSDWATEHAARFTDDADLPAGDWTGDRGEPLWELPTIPPSGEFYAWLAGECGLIRDLRRDLVGGHGIDRRRIAFMGYWRRGAEGP